MKVLILNHDEHMALLTLVRRELDRLHPARTSPDRIDFFHKLKEKLT